MLAVATIFVSIGIIAIVVNFVLKQYILFFVRKLMSKSKSVFAQKMIEHNLFRQLSHVAPGLAIYFLIPAIETKLFESTKLITSVVQHLAMVYLLIVVVLFINTFMNVINDFYKSLPYSKRHPIRGYLQVAKIVIWCITAVLAVSILINQSPWAFFTGLGAISAVLILVFKDTIMGFVASIQVSAYDMVRVGDWIQLDNLGANGDVIDVSINTVKVRNFDNTIVTIPTYALISNGVINWRGMSESGGRRIKRAINIDMDTVHFAEFEFIEKLKGLDLLGKDIHNKVKEIEDYNRDHGINATLPVNGRRLTNLGLFRAYATNYLKHHPKIHKEMTLMVRQLEPTSNGIPVQLYVFTNDVNWVHYESIQADIFDHLIAALPLFELRAFQTASGRFGQSA